MFLTPIILNASFHVGSRTNFGIASSFILHLLLIIRPPRPQSNSHEHEDSVPNPPDTAGSDSRTDALPSGGAFTFTERHSLDDLGSAPRWPSLDEEYVELQYLIKRWRWVMRIASRGAGGRKGLMTLGLLRLDALLSELQQHSTLS